MSVREIRALPLEERLQIMEALWEDLHPHFESDEVSRSWQSCWRQELPVSIPERAGFWTGQMSAISSRLNDKRSDFPGCRRRHPGSFSILRSSLFGTRKIPSGSAFPRTSKACPATVPSTPLLTATFTACLAKCFPSASSIAPDPHGWKSLRFSTCREIPPGSGRNCLGSGKSRRKLKTQKSPLLPAGFFKGEDFDSARD